MLPTHGSEEWSLEDYEWADGIGRFEYSRINPETGMEETSIVERAQPMMPEHAGWVRTN